jgi:hypothetical protein
MSPIIKAAAFTALAMTGIVSAQAQDTPVPSDHAAQNPAMKSPDHMTKAPLAKGKTSFTMDEAKSRLEKAGYTHVTNLVKDPDGLWQARVMHHGKWVNAAVDYKGNVAAR